MGGGVLKVGAFAVDSDPGTAFFGRRGGSKGLERRLGSFPRGPVDMANGNGSNGGRRSE